MHINVSVSIIILKYNNYTMYNTLTYILYSEDFFYGFKLKPVLYIYNLLLKYGNPLIKFQLVV